MATLRGVCVGAGYFSKFHYEAWNRIPEVRIVACCVRNEERAREITTTYGITKSYVDYREMFDAENPDFVDLITPPETHLKMCTEATQRGIDVICQKPLAPTISDAKKIVEVTEAADIRFMVHENFRFQPWYREIKRLIDEGIVGTRLHSLSARCRMGDGWGSNAYLARQSYFRSMPRMLIYETGVHFIDTFRFLAGEVDRVFCVLRTLNPVISGEDCGLLVFEFQNGAVGTWDANRYNEPNHPDPRYTFGKLLVELDGGSIRLDMDGTLTVQPLGQPERPHNYEHSTEGFAGDCCFAAQRHFIDRLLDGNPFETRGRDYLKNLVLQEAFYLSAEKGCPISIEANDP